MGDTAVNIERREKVPDWQKQAWGEFLDMLDERAAALMKKGESDGVHYSRKSSGYFQEEE